ncbi:MULTISPECIES: Ig-like domain-containing protein [Vibrio]|uniref:Ig-like domain-containing protein n=1 Tax=Vibrio TaxID=662 RepID=UPI0003181FD6|nr:DUF1566 domain-containing protein [Vibrio cyclitrophicus]ERM61196.1 putative RTX toxin [Vibrio cyclitrophicus FF75]OEE46448.1 hypothetical protein OAG_03095 [Vibrio cyclitrophicus FF75]
MKLMKEIIITLCSTISLFGCGEGSDSSSQTTQPTSPSEVNIEASVVQSKALVDIESQTVVKVDSDIDFRLTSVNLVSDGTACEVTSVEGMTFTTLSAQVGECQFEYKVEPVEQDVYSGQASSLARVSVSETADNNTLPNLSETTNVETPVTIDLSEEFSDDLDTSIYTVSEEVTLLGSGSVEVDSLNNTITYSPADIGVTRIMYSMSDGSSTKLGNIDVAVSDTGNTPPIANDYIREGKLAKDMSVEIDLTDYVSDAEDSVILDSVRAYNAETEITSTSKHTFTFQSSEAGPHEVAYTVTDGRGGYAVGQVYLEVEPDFSLVQDWDDITILDSVLNSEITYSAPMSKAMADYVNSDYLTVQTENGDYGPNGAQIAEMNWLQAKNYCETRNGRLPQERELEALAETDPYKNSNWPTNTPYWTATRVSETDGSIVSLIDGTFSSQSIEGVGYVSCVYLRGDVNDFSILDVENSDNNEPTSTLRYVTATLLDPDGIPAPYQNITFWTRNEQGGFGVTKNELEIESMTDSDGSATAVYSFTSGYDDFVMAQYRDSALFTAVSLQSSGFDVTNPDDWNVSKVYGDVLLADYEPIIDETGTKVALGDMNEYLTAISKTPIIGSQVTIKFGIDRTEADKLNGGAINVIFQQVSSLAPDINEWCDVMVHGDCEWSRFGKQTAGFPQNDTRSLGFTFDYYYQIINFKNANEIVASGTLLNRTLTQLYYKVVIKDGSLYIYQSTQFDYSDESLVIDYPMSDINIDTNKFFYFGLSGGGDGADGTKAKINYLDFDF